MRELQKFVTKWNTDHDMLVYLPQVVRDKIDRIELRFNPDSRPNKQEDKGWRDFLLGIEAKSEGALEVTSNEVMYGYGFAELKISGNTNSDRLIDSITSSIKWVGNSFLK